MGKLVEADKLNIFIVRGTNWSCEVKMDEYNAQFSLLQQAQEAGTRAVEQVYGIEKGLNVLVDAGEEIPVSGGILEAFIKDGDESESFMLFTYEMLANAGLYKESVRVYKKTEAEIDKTLASFSDDVNTDEVLQQFKRSFGDNPLFEKRTPLKMAKPITSTSTAKNPPATPKPKAKRKRKSKSDDKPSDDKDNSNN